MNLGKLEVEKGLSLEVSRIHSVRQVNVKSFLSILEKKNVVSKVLIYNSDNTVWQSLTNSHYQILGLNIVRY